MDKTSMFMIFESTEQTGNQQRLINPLPLIQLESIPGNYSFVLVFCVSGLEPLPEHVVSLSFISPSGGKTDLISNQVMSSPPPSDQTNSLGATLKVDIRNMVFREEGVHTVSLTVDSDNFTGYLPVRKRNEA